MKRSIVIFAAAASLVAAAFSGSQLLTAQAVARQSSGFLLLPPAAPAGQQVLYGHIKSLGTKGGHLELRFDPAFLLSGLTATRKRISGLSSPAVRLRWSSSQPVQRCTRTHSPSPRTVIAIGSISEPHSAARSPGRSSSRCLLHKQLGQWLR